MNFLKIFLPLFFIAFALGELAKMKFPGGISVGLFDIAVILLSIYYLKKIWKREFYLKIPVIIFILVSFFSLLINIFNYQQYQLLIGSLYLLRWIAYTGIYFVAASLSSVGKKITHKLMLYSGIFILALGYLQLLIYPNLKALQVYGWDDHINRIVSVYFDPNFAGVIFVFLLIYFFVFKDKLFSNKYLSYFILASTFVAIILTYSRGAFLMLVVSALTYSIIMKNWKIIAGTILILALAFIILIPNFNLQSTNLLRTYTISQRFESMKEGLYIAKKNPLGVGFNTYRYARENYGFRDTSVYGPSNAGAGVDNSFILILATAGILGLIAYLFLLYKMFRLGLNNIKKNEMAIVLIISLSGLLVNSMFINSLIYSFIMAWIFLLAGLTENKSR